MKCVKYTVFQNCKLFTLYVSNIQLCRVLPVIKLYYAGLRIYVIYSLYEAFHAVFEAPNHTSMKVCILMAKI